MAPSIGAIPKETADVIRLPDKTKLTVPRAAAHLREYWAENPAVWDLFERDVKDHDVFDPMDVVSLNALNARMTMSPMTNFWVSPERAEAELLLRDVPRGELTNLVDVADTARRLAAVADRCSRVTGWRRGGTRVGKLLYRMRPGLAPIWDREVGRYYPDHVGGSWEDWYLAAMRDIKSNADDLRAAVARCGNPHDRISPVRAWDVLLWSLAKAAPT